MKFLYHNLLESLKDFSRCRESNLPFELRMVYLRRLDASIANYNASVLREMCDPSDNNNPFNK